MQHFPAQRRPFPAHANESPRGALPPCAPGPTRKPAWARFVEAPGARTACACARQCMLRVHHGPAYPRALQNCIGTLSQCGLRLTCRDSHDDGNAVIMKLSMLKIMLMIVMMNPVMIMMMIIMMTTDAGAVPG